MEDRLKIDTDNVYRTPEKFGLTLIAAINLGDYINWDIRAVWVDNEAEIYFGADFGDVNTPFQNIKNINRLQKMKGIRDLENKMNEMGWSIDDKEDFRRQIRSHLLSNPKYA